MFLNHTQLVSMVAWSPCGNYIASASINGELFIWKVSLQMVIERLVKRYCMLKQITSQCGGLVCLLTWFLFHIFTIKWAQWFHVKNVAVMSLSLVLQCIFGEPLLRGSGSIFMKFLFLSRPTITWNLLALYKKEQKNC